MWYTAIPVYAMFYWVSLGIRLTVACSRMNCYHYSPYSNNLTSIPHWFTTNNRTLSFHVCLSPVNQRWSVLDPQSHTVDTTMHQILQMFFVGVRDMQAVHIFTKLCWYLYLIYTYSIILSLKVKCWNGKLSNLLLSLGHYMWISHGCVTSSFSRQSSIIPWPYSQMYIIYPTCSYDVRVGIFD